MPETATMACQMFPHIPIYPHYAHYTRTIMFSSPLLMVNHYRTSEGHPWHVIGSCERQKLAEIL